MSSAALRSRTGRADGGGADDDASGPAPILDTDAQEALVNELEADARRQATVWRRVFGALSIAWGMYFVNSAAHAASGDVTMNFSHRLERSAQRHEAPRRGQRPLAPTHVSSVLRPDCVIED